MTDSLDTAAASLVATIREISDPIERYQAVKNLEVRLADGFKQVKADIAKELHYGRTWHDVGEMLGVTGSRAEQISRASR